MEMYDRHPQCGSKAETSGLEIEISKTDDSSVRM